ncbi:sensor domain-containing diguanylate cyclase [Bosea sp. (in: a-proteobacteria)]|uniref:GGDEF domain-containing protein n=1 Tax=Bosea sp. (in: a-proteobacteria) TaxID=1871050 RepID=UPI00120F09B3|nr:sensor domain-containing diguanylate cyclase [Bosea sp. (in: a-proteobacteria)]TAJ30425.1 MAG: sensor domain-containing diguanylate cyclase [Bosea sp. (in: a-proteobacteria)]
MYQDVNPRSILTRAHAPEVAVLMRHFEMLASGPAGAQHEALQALAIQAAGDDIMFMSPTPTGDYRYETCGRTLPRTTGRDRTGGYVSNLQSDVAEFTIRCYDRALAEGVATYTVHRTVRTARVGIFERLILPTTDAEGGRHLIVFCRQMSFREEFLMLLMETSPFGIVAVEAVRDEDARLTGLGVLSANQRVAALCGTDPDMLFSSDVREILPFLANEETWARLRYAVELLRPDQFEVEFLAAGRQIWLQVSLALLGDGLVITLSDISALMRANQSLEQRAATLALEVGIERATRRALSEEIGQREEREKELRRLAETDPLTALLNRRSFTERANAAIQSSSSDASAICLLIIDLDHFKQINDTHGHPAGDAAIRAFADLLLGVFRTESCLIGRFGGEEFAILIRGAAGDALEKASLMQAALAERALPVSETLELAVTASCGIACRREGETLAALTNRADQALYRAKKEGRNRIALADEQPLANAA